MNAITAFVLGVLVGWLIEWIIDWWYWRRHRADISRSDSLLQERVKSAESRSADLERQLAEQRSNAANQQAKLTELESQLSNQKINASNLADLESQLNAEKTNNTSLQAKLAEMEAARQVNRMMPASPADQPAIQPLMDPGADSLAEPHVNPVEAPVNQPVELSGVESLADPGVIPAAEIGRNIQASEPVKAAAVERDDLEIIKGIGPVIARKLNQVGIYTFADLAALTPDRLREMVGDIISRLADEDAILAEARQLAAQKRQGV